MKLAHYSESSLNYSAEHTSIYQITHCHKDTEYHIFTEGNYYNTFNFSHPKVKHQTVKCLQYGPDILTRFRFDTRTSALRDRAGGTKSFLI